MSGIDYKRLIKSRNVRIKVIGLLDCIPDKQMVKWQYAIKTGRKLNLEQPVRYTEKLQWYKLNYRDPLMARCADKYEVRSYVEECGCGDILNELIGVYEEPTQIDFEKLPRQFVLKDTLGGGSNSVFICRNKQLLDTKKVMIELERWIYQKTNKQAGREWVYDNKRARIIAERYLEQDDGDLADYKFFCFNGKVEYFYVRRGYALDHECGLMSFYDRYMNYLPGVGMDYCGIAPKGFNIDRNMVENMISYAERLAFKFPHVRVDLYALERQVVFGELTFFNASGYMNFEPDEFDFILGEKFILPNIEAGKVGEG